MQNRDLKVLQLIDSLSTGGAERVSVNLANALSGYGIESFICATRKGGPLEAFIKSDVQKFILNKKLTLDIKAIFKLIKFIRKNHINIIHAHSNSFFMAILCKPFTGVKIVWHDHYGNAEQLDKRSAKIIKSISFLFDYIISVNILLEKWAKKHLNISKEKISFLQNFAQLLPQEKNLNLPGTQQTRIVCLANLRQQKDHLTLLHSFKKIYDHFPEWHLLLVGIDYEDEYSDVLKAFIDNENFENNIHILGTRTDSADILLHSTIGVLSSKSEGLPVALLEYGLAKLPVVCTDVGQCAEVLGYGKYGKVVPSKKSELLADALIEVIENKEEQNLYSIKFFEQVNLHYSEKAVIAKIVNIYKGLING